MNDDAGASSASGARARRDAERLRDRGDGVQDARVAAEGGGGRQPPEGPDRQLDVLQLAALHRQVGPQAVRQAVRRPRQVRRGDQRQLGVLREGPPAAAAGSGRSAATSSRSPTTWPPSGCASGYVAPIDYKNVPNAENLVSNLRSVPYDPKRQFTLPWQSGAIGIGYDIKQTGGELKSLEALFDPKYKGKVTMLAEQYDSAGTVLLMKGKDPTKATVDEQLERDRGDREGQRRRPVPALHRQRLHDGPDQGQHRDRARLLRRPRAAAVRQPEPALRLPRGGRDALHRQHDAAARRRASRTRPRR